MSKYQHNSLPLQAGVGSVREEVPSSELVVLDITYIKGQETSAVISAEVGISKGQLFPVVDDTQANVAKKEWKLPASGNYRILIPKLQGEDVVKMNFQGEDAAPALKVIQSLLYTALQEGDAGNNITFLYERAENSTIPLSAKKTVKRITVTLAIQAGTPSSGELGDLKYTANAAGDPDLEGINGDGIQITNVVPTTRSQGLLIDVPFLGAKEITVYLGSDAGDQAAKIIQEGTYTAKGAGPDGNEISIEYLLDTGSSVPLESVSVDVPSKTIQVFLKNVENPPSSGIYESDTEAQEVKAAIENDVDSNALVTFTIPGGSETEIQEAEVKTFLEGGGLNFAPNTTGDDVIAAIAVHGQASDLVTVAERLGGNSGAIQGVGSVTLAGGVDGDSDTSATQLIDLINNAPGISDLVLAELNGGATGGDLQTENPLTFLEGGYPNGSLDLLMIY